MNTEIQLGFMTLPVPHYYLSRTGVSAISVAIDWDLSPIMTQVWQYTARLGRKSDALEDIISDLEKIANFAITERDRIIVERGGTVDREAMVARFKALDVKHGGPDPAEPSTEDEIMGAEFDSLKPGDVIENGGGDRWVVTEIPNGSSVRKGTIRMRHVTWGKETASHEFWRDMYVRNHWRKVPDPKPVDAAFAKPESDFDSLKPGDRIRGGELDLTHKVDYVYPEFIQISIGGGLSRREYETDKWQRVAPHAETT